MKLYISGPMTGLPNFNYDAFHKMAANLRKAGYEVINPAENFDGDQTKEMSEYMRKDCSEILESDQIVVLSGWERSVGATFEVKLAEQCGIPVMKVTNIVEDPNGEISAVLEYLETKGMKFDGEKPRWDLLPYDQVEKIVRVLTIGARKYKPDNWQKVKDPINRYSAALMRHIVAWEKGEIMDPETGEEHLAHAGCCLLFLMWHSEENGKSSLNLTDEEWFNIGRVREQHNSSTAARLIIILLSWMGDTRIDQIEGELGDPDPKILPLSDSYKDPERMKQRAKARKKRGVK